jgi:hypothetical protein
MRGLGQDLQPGLALEPLVAGGVDVADRGVGDVGIDVAWVWLFGSELRPVVLLAVLAWLRVSEASVP